MAWLSSAFAAFASSTIGKLFINFFWNKAKKFLIDKWKRFVVLPAEQSKKKAEHDKALNEYHEVLNKPDLTNQESEDAFKKFVSVTRPIP